MLKYEFKKLLIYRRGIFLIALFLVIEILGIVLFSKPYNQTLEENREVYDSYLSEVEGSLTPEKREYIEGEMERLDRVHREIESLRADYYSGVISEEAYKTEFEKLLPHDELYMGFSELYTQYIFVRENENRSFLYTGGWEYLLTDITPDYVLLVVLVILLTPVFCEEYSSRMDCIIITHEKGAKYYVIIKLLTAVIITIALTLSVEVSKLLYSAVRFGLSHGEFTLQSLLTFGKTVKELSIIEAYFLSLALKLFGYVYASILILFLSVLMKKFSLSLMAGIALLPLPFLTVTSVESFLCVPAPWALTVGNIFLSPTTYKTDMTTGELTVSTAEMNIGEIGCNVLVSLLIMFAMVIFTSRKNSNKHRKTVRKVKTLAFVFTLLFIFTGCSADTDEGVIFNAVTSDYYESESFVIDMSRGNFINKETGEVYDFPLDAFSKINSTVGRNLFAYGGKVYYFHTESLRPNAGYPDSYENKISIKALDLSSLSESVYKSFNCDTEWFFGLLNRESDAPSGVGAFFIHDGDVFFKNNEGDICRIDGVSGEISTYIEDISSTDFSYDGENIYYTDMYGRLVIHNIESKTERAIDDVVANSFLVSPKGVFFLNLRDSSTLYFWSEGSEVKKLDDGKIYRIFYDENYIWTLGGTDGNELSRFDLSGENKVSVSVDGTVCGIGFGDGIYVYNYENNAYSVVNKDAVTNTDP